jgi:fluoride exporter
VLIYLWIAVGSALGGVGRYWLSGFVAERIGETFPWGTIIVNVTGSFVIGFFATLTGPDGRLLVGSTARQFVMIGICGGYTTFSSFSLQTLELMRDGDWVKAGANAVGSVVLCLVAVWLGYALGMGLNTGKGTLYANPSRSRSAANLHWGKRPVGTQAAL